MAGGVFDGSFDERACRALTERTAGEVSRESDIEMVRAVVPGFAGGGCCLEDRNILNAQLAWEHGTWTVTGYATNLTNQHYPAALNSNLYFAGAPRQ